ncbi:sensor histidine kinase [Actinoplanes aureus]|uniref:histidine kinase n=1 Tax=Actinoplanes aureus TaxID=2792083 RepID=A0A931FZC3_9ACTN|nr:histidine kinase [Actinoplanes aureus]MBG0564612.1 sensor histidine kinase [Actinoplanes aureus]
MKRAMAALTVAAYLTLLVDVLGDNRPAASLLPATAFLLVATLGFEWVQRRGGRWAGYAHVAVLFLIGFAVFAVSEASLGATLMLVVLVSQAVLLLPVAAVVVVVVSLPLFHAGMALDEGLREGLGLLAAAVFAAAVTKLLVREQQARAELAGAHARLREYAVQVEGLAAAQERNRVARDIHDGLGHALTVVQMQIKAARALLGPRPERADEMLAKAQEQAEEALREVRRSVGALREPRPAVPLPDALRALADETSAAGVPTEVDVTGMTRRLLAAAEESLFRAAQEGLTNVRKHARATRASLVLDYSRASAVRLEVRDDGDGVGEGEGFGLLGLRERATQVGGHMTFESVPGGGSTLRMEVPG